MAINLPLELQQHIFSFLDSQSFYAARNVCRWWNVAARDSITLTRQLRQLPIEPEASAARTDADRLYRLYSEAAHTLMLGVRTEEETDDKPSISEKINKPKIALSADHTRAVALDTRTITLYDQTSKDNKIISERPLNDLRTAIGGGPWFKCAPTSVFELALSNRGNLLAIALERTIQIYDLEGDADSWPIASYISSASGHYIAGLQFEHNDSLLRVQLSNKGVVVYLGTPSETSADLAHWQGKGGLRHAYLDTSKTVTNPVSSAGVGTERLAGLQLLRPFQSGWLFAAQKHGANSASTYCIGHIPASTVDDHVATAETSATILASLPSTYSAYLSSVSSAWFWGKLPSARDQHPCFSLSSDGNFLALVEANTKGIEAQSRSFVYRMPGELQLERALLEKKMQQFENEELVAEENTIVEADNKDKKTTAAADDFLIHRVPLSLGHTKGRILDFKIEKRRLDREDKKLYDLSLTTDVGFKTWTLEED